MGGAYTVTTLLERGIIGLLLVLAVALVIAGTLLKQDNRIRFILWVAATYMAAWTAWVLYNTVILTRVLMKLIK